MENKLEVKLLKAIKIAKELVETAMTEGWEEYTSLPLQLKEIAVKSRHTYDDDYTTGEDRVCNLLELLYDGGYNDIIKAVQAVVGCREWTDYFVMMPTDSEALAYIRQAELAHNQWEHKSYVNHEDKVEHYMYMFTGKDWEEVYSYDEFYEDCVEVA